MLRQAIGASLQSAENMKTSQHTDFNEDMTNESASVACSNSRLWKPDTQKEWRSTSLMPLRYKNSSEDEITNVIVLLRRRTCRGQGLRPLN